MPETQTPRRDYRATLNLPQTDFPMRAELPKREPDRVRWWAERGTYLKRLAKNAGNPSFTLHDGPPYANGDLHMGHFLNRVLKDAFVKINLLDGKHADFVPGWDMHGLPIELETLKHLKLDFHHVDPLELRAKCEEHSPLLAGPPTRRDPPHGRLRPLRRAVHDDRPGIRGDRICKRSPTWRKSSSSTKAYARPSGASTTRPRWQKRRSNIRITSRRSVYVRFRANERNAPTSSNASASQATTSHSRSSSGRPRLGRCRQTSRSRSIRSLNTRSWNSMASISSSQRN